MYMLPQNTITRCNGELMIYRRRVGIREGVRVEGWGVLLLFIVHMFFETPVIRSFINAKALLVSRLTQQTRKRNEVIPIGQEHCRDKKESVLLMRSTDSQN